MTISFTELILSVPIDSVVNSASKASSASNWTEVIKIIPSVLWVILIFIALLMFYKPIRYDLIPKLSGIKFMGVELSLAKLSMNAALELAEKNRKWKVDVPNSAKDNVLNRAREHLKILEGTKILWVDDVPDNNLNESKMFGQLKVEIQFSTNTDEAIDIIKRRNFDVIISDMARGDKADAGIQFLNRLLEMQKQIPVIFYVGIFNPKLGVPPGAFGITNRPDELLHLVLDALERKKY